MIALRKTLLTAGCVLVCLTSLAAPEPHTVAAAFKPNDPWKEYPTRTLDDLGRAASQAIDPASDVYGGWRGHRVKGTGFFRTQKINGRWWLIDPDGYYFIHKGVVSVSRDETPGAIAACIAKFGSETNWASATADYLRQQGFNGLGGWSDTKALRDVSHPLVYTRSWSFMAAYGKQRGGTFSQPGHTGYPHDCIFVFDPGFETFCDTYAKQLSATKDDPWLLGHFSDNEMPLKRDTLKQYLTLPVTDPGYQAALKWLCGRHGPYANAHSITSTDEADFIGVVIGRYSRVVSRAIKKYDPNHLYLGSRLYGGDIARPEVFKACGPYVDVISMNLYHAWTPSRERLEMWSRESGCPVLITEWYAKAIDSGMPNTDGAGWLVKTQADRGLFYQNFTLALLESRVCVGWHWFKYMDNDLDDKKADPSNQDSNKGMFNNRYEPYQPLIDAMKPINERAYSLTDFFDGHPLPATPK